MASMKHASILVLAVLATACGRGEQAGPAPAPEVAAGDAAFAARFREQLLDARPGDVIEVPPGKHSRASGGDPLLSAAGRIG